jgi:hypothetical protein
LLEPVLSSSSQWHELSYDSVYLLGYFKSPIPGKILSEEYFGNYAL